MTSPRVLRAGEHGLLLEFGSLAEAMGARVALERAPIAGVTDVVSGARTLMLRFDPTVASRADVEAAVASRADVEAAVAALDALPGPGHGAVATGAAPVEIPVVYDGPDLADTAALLGLSPEALVAEHTGRTWVCAFGGFAPGFGYLVSAATPPLAVPRLEVPRTRVPAGAVGLAGEFSGVYPRESPGGWRLIGRTTLPMWDLARTPPATLTVGTAARFRAIGRP